MKKYYGNVGKDEYSLGLHSARTGKPIKDKYDYALTWDAKKSKYVRVKDFYCKLHKKHFKSRTAFRNHMNKFGHYLEL